MLSFQLSAVTPSSCAAFLHLYYLTLQKVPESRFVATVGAASFLFEALIGSVYLAPMGSSRV